MSDRDPHIHFLKHVEALATAPAPPEKRNFQESWILRIAPAPVVQHVVAERAFAVSAAIFAAAGP